ncbi:hypothetical protein HYT55_00060 [Candidatus Woesearchaeota archaeon]|nr:hypothetical protein [Candidatus Woesearchaeota archaeon]
MAEESVFRGVISFLDKLGVYDIILPFLLVFTLVFAILEKTKILGVEKVKDQEYTKKNINAMVAFVIGFLVIASTQLVAVISSVMANVVLLLILSICFLLLVGSFYADKQFSLENSPKWVKFLMVVMFIGVVVIFLNALGWLETVFGVFYLMFTNLDAEWAATSLFLIIIIGFIFYVTHEPKTKSSGKDEGKK